MGLLSPPFTFDAASITPTSIGAAPEVYRYVLRDNLPSEGFTLPVESWVYSDMRIPQGSPVNTAEYVITLPNEANLRFGNKLLICGEPASNVGSSRPVRIRKQNGETLFYNAGGSGFLSWSSLYEYQFSLGWTRIPLPSNVENKEFKNQPNGYVGLNASGQISNAYLTNATALTIQSWVRNAIAIVGVTTDSAHNLTSGQTVIITGTTRATGLGSNIDGTWVVDGVYSGTQFTFVHPESLIATGTGGTIPIGGIFSSADYSKLLGIQQGAQVNVKPDWNAASGTDSEILNKPTIPDSPVNADWSATTGLAQILNKPTIPAAQVSSDWNATSGVAQILNKPTIPDSPVNADWDATTGLAQILNKPTIPAAQVNSDWNATSGISQILNKPNLPTKVAWGPMVILRFANWGRGQTGYAPGTPPTGMFPLTPTTGNVGENFNPDIYHPRLFNAGEFFGVGRQYKIVCAVRCTGIAFDGIHCQLRWYNGTTSDIVAGLSDFGGGNDGIASKSYFATSDTLTASNDWWMFVPYFGAYDGANFANIQDCSIIAYLV